jgi:hypothetical protein
MSEKDDASPMTNDKPARPREYWVRDQDNTLAITRGSKNCPSNAFRVIEKSGVVKRSAYDKAVEALKLASSHAPECDLEQARQIAKEYSQPNNMIDSGNLFFALGEFIAAADQLAEVGQKILDRMSAAHVEGGELLDELKQALAGYPGKP